MKPIFCCKRWSCALLLLTLDCWLATLPSRIQAQAAAAANGPQTTAKATAVALNECLATIPFEMYFNEIFVQVRVNHSDSMWFVVDSGAGGWIVDRAHATRLGLHLEQDTAQGTGAGSGTYDVSYVKDVSFSLSDFNIEVPLIGVIDLSAHKSQIGRESEGLVGYDFFEKFIVEIDYENKVMRLFDPKTYHYSGVGESIPIIVDQEARNPFFTAEVSVQGAAPQKRKLLIDTGSNDALDDSFVAQSTGPKIEIVGGVGLGKEFKINVGRVSRLRLGGVSFEDVDAGAGGVALVGGEVLRRFTVIFDFAHTRMILEPNEHLKDAFLFDASGVTLRLVPETGDFEVHSVMQGSPASDAGIHEGDVIQSIDGLSSKHFNLHQVESMFQRVGAEHHLTVKRGDKVSNFDIKLRKLL